MRSVANLRVAWRMRGQGPGRLLALLFALGVAVGAAKAETAGAVPYLGIGVAAGGQSVGLDQQEARVNGAVQAPSLPPIGGLFVLAGVRTGHGRLHFGPEVAFDLSRHALADTPACRLGRACARAGLSGRVGPVVRLRAGAGWAIAPGVMVLAGAGVSLADVSIDAGFAQAASAHGEGAALNRARSPFATASRARGAHAILGLEHRIDARRSLRVDILRERLWIATDARLFIFTATASGPSMASALLDQTGGFARDTTALRVSVLVRF